MFPAAAAQLSSTNNFTAGTNFNSILLTGSGYALSGNALALTAGLTSTIGAGTSNTVSLPVMLVGAQTWSSTNANSTLNAGASTINLNGANLTVAGSGDTVLGAIIDPANVGGANGIIKTGTGKLTLSQAITIPMTVDLRAGLTQFNDLATQTTVNLNGGALAIDAAAATGVVATTSGIINPGGVGTTGILNVQGNLTLNSAATLAVDLNGTTAGTGFDQVNVTGAAALNGAALTVTESPASATGNTFTILTATGGVSGTFAGLADLSTFVANGRILQIDYTANSVVLTDLGAAPATSADLAVTKTDSPDPVAPGGSITYTITVTNSGSANATGVVLTDVIPIGTTFASAMQTTGPAFVLTSPAIGGTGTITGTIATLAAGASATFTVVATANASALGGASISNTASVASVGLDANIANNTAVQATLVTTTTDLQITKNDFATTETPGTPVIYTVTVTNAGSGAVSGVVINDSINAALLSNVTFTAAGTGGAAGFVSGSGNINQTVDLPAGATITYMVMGTINPALTGTLTNSANLVLPAGVVDSNPANNQISDINQLAPSADLSITKTDGASSVNAGGTVNYTIVVSNAGPSDVTGATVTDMLPAALSGATFTAAGTGGASGFADGSGNLSQILTLPAGSSVTYNVMANVSASATGSLANTATIAAALGVDANPANDMALDTDTIVALPQTDLEITKTDNLTSVAAGGSVTYTVVVRNNGPTAVIGATVSDAVATGLTGVTFTASGLGGATGFVSGTGSINQMVNLPVGASITYVITGAVSTSATGSVVNTATIMAPSSVIDTNAANDSAMDTNTIAVAETQTDLTLTKTDDLAEVAAGENLTYTLVVTNTGTTAAENVVISDPIPANTTFVSAMQTAGPTFTLTTPATGGTGSVMASIGSLAAGASATFTIVVLVEDTALGGTTISNTARVTSSTAESSQVNNTATVAATVAISDDLVCVVETANFPGEERTATLEDDADNPGSGVLIVTGTSRNDVIVVEPRPGSSTQLRVLIGGRVIGFFNRSEVQHIVVFAGSGNDKVVINGSLTIPATLFGEAGNDTLVAARGNDGLDGGLGNDTLVAGLGDDILCGAEGNDIANGQGGNDIVGGDAGNDKVVGESGNDLLLGNEGNDFLSGGAGDDKLFGMEGNDKIYGDSGNDVAVGGDGNDHVYGSSGRDLLIGGDGVDQLFGDGHQDILISGSTTFDADQVALMALLAEWASSNSLAVRMENLRFGGGANESFTLDDSTVLDDGRNDTLWGQGDVDWFFTGFGDKVRDRTRIDFTN